MSHHIDHRSIPKPNCVLCAKPMAVKEIRRYTKPGHDLCVFKCDDCGLEYPVIIDAALAPPSVNHDQG